MDIHLCFNKRFRDYGMAATVENGGCCGYSCGRGRCGISHDFLQRLDSPISRIDEPALLFSPALVQQFGDTGLDMGFSQVLAPDGIR
jgi:hypothetical protein